MSFHDPRTGGLLVQCICDMIHHWKTMQSAALYTVRPLTGLGYGDWSSRYCLDRRALTLAPPFTNGTLTGVTTISYATGTLHFITDVTTSGLVIWRPNLIYRGWRSRFICWSSRQRPLLQNPSPLAHHHMACELHPAHSKESRATNLAASCLPQFSLVTLPQHRKNNVLSPFSELTRWSKGPAV